MLKLPDNLPVIATARLPGAYEAAKTALANCEAVDECKDWADKAAALASYARQVGDDELLKRSMRIQARALRRAGELLAEENAQGHRNELLDGTVPKLGIAAAAEEAGFSERQRKTALKLAAKDEDEFEALIESYNPPTITELAEGNGPKPFRNTGDENWYTPPEYLEAARAVLGGFDLDPASSREAQETVKAARFFTREQDGLSQPWHGRVWLNPPFSRADSFVTKLLAEFNAGNVEAAILLTNACTDTDWFHKVFSVCRAICFTDGRISFVHASRGSCGGGRVGQTFFYFGNDIDAFAASFEPIGTVIPFLDRLPLAALHERVLDIFEASLPAVLQITPEGERAALERQVKQHLQQMRPASLP